MKKRANGVSMRLTEQWICIRIQYTCLHLKGCYGVHAACMAEPSGQSWTCYIYIYIEHTCVLERTGGGAVQFRRNMRWNDKRIPGQSRKISRNRRCCVISSVEEICKEGLFHTDLRVCTEKLVRAELAELNGL